MANIKTRSDTGSDTRADITLIWIYNVNPVSDLTRSPYRTSLPVVCSKQNKMAEAEASRFREVTDDETYAFLEEMKNPNTRRKTVSDCKIFTEWLASENELRPMEEIEPTVLDSYLARFFLSVRNQKHEEYEPDTLKAIQSSISRYLTEKNNINILQDKEFSHSRDCLKSKRVLVGE